MLAMGAQHIMLLPIGHSNVVNVDRGNSPTVMMTPVVQGGIATRMIVTPIYSF
jgi:hypothetical protein